MMEKCRRNLKDLWEIVEKEFYAFSDEDIEKLFDSLPKRVKSRLRTRGWSTKYYEFGLICSFEIC